MLLLLLSQVIDSWELISTVEKKKNLAKKHFDTIKKIYVNHVVTRWPIITPGNEAKSVAECWHLPLAG